MNDADNIAPLIRQIKKLSPNDTIGKAIVLFQIECVNLLPVVSNSRLVGIVSAEKLLALANEKPDIIEVASINMVMDAAENNVHASTNIQEAQRFFIENSISGAPVVSGGTYIGWLYNADILGAATHNPSPPRIGGMATPLGVYLYTTSITAGVGKFGLFATGLLMAFSLVIIQNLAVLSTALLYKQFHLDFFRIYTLLFLGLPVQSIISPQYEMVLVSINSIVTTFLFLVVLRFAPFMSGYHAAEHMSVNAIENGEALTVENVAKMSRVHPRCGTNLISILSFICLGVTLIAFTLRTDWGQKNISFVAAMTIYLIVIIAVTWRTVGIWIQEKWTTRVPTKKELESGVKAAIELMSTYRMASNVRQTTIDRILMMGIQYVMAGVIIVDILTRYIQPFIDTLIYNILKH